MTSKHTVPDLSGEAQKKDGLDSEGQRSHCASLYSLRLRFGEGIWKEQQFGFTCEWLSVCGRVWLKYSLESKENIVGHPPETDPHAGEGFRLTLRRCLDEISCS